MGEIEQSNELIAYVVQPVPELEALVGPICEHRSFQVLAQLHERLQRLPGTIRAHWPGYVLAPDFGVDLRSDALRNGDLMEASTEQAHYEGNPD